MPRQGLNRRKVLEAALDIVDDLGLDHLTMRQLGQHLGVEAPSLYKHVAGKADILDGIVDLVYEEIEFDTAEDEFRARVVSYSNSFRQALLRHPNVVQLLAMKQVTGEATIQLVEVALAELAAVGIDPILGRRYLNVTVNFIVGHAMSQVGEMSVTPAEIMELRRGFEPALYPNVAKSIALEPVDHDAEFELGINLIIDAIERKVAQHV